MGCGTSSNQVHQINNPIPIDHATKDKSNAKQIDNLCYGKCYLFGQSSGERKVVCFNATKQYFQTLSSRIRIPTPKIKLEPIQILYEESQEIILPDLLKVTPHPPFNYMFGTFCKKDQIFLCGGITYEGTDVTSQAYFYLLNNESQSKTKNTIGKNFVKFDEICPMSTKRFGHMGVYFCEKEGKNECIYIFGGRDENNQALSSCQKFDLISKKWKDISPMTIPRFQGQSMLFMGNIYVFGGVSILRQYPDIIQVYNPKTNIWRGMNIRLHRGIRACLIVSPQPNEIIIFGGNNGEKDLKSVYKVNLIDETYVWESDMPESLSSIKAAYEKQRISIFSNNSNQINVYNFDGKGWKTLGTGYKGYIPIKDISKFTSVTEPLHIKFNAEQIKQLEEVKCGKLQSLFFAFGNENYPCCLNFHESQTGLLMKMNKVSMKLRLKSKMTVCQIKEQFFICGGAEQNEERIKNQAFIYNPSLPIHKSSREIAPMNNARFYCGATYSESNQSVYVFGGKLKNRSVTKNCQRYDCVNDRWEDGGELIRARFGVKAFGLQTDEKNKNPKILLIGGKEEDGIDSSFVEIYDSKNRQVISFAQFPALVQNGSSSQFFIVQVQEDQKNKINQQNSLLQVSQFYNKKEHLASPAMLKTLKSPDQTSKRPAEIPSFAKVIIKPILTPVSTPKPPINSIQKPKIIELKLQQIEVKGNHQISTGQNKINSHLNSLSSEKQESDLMVQESLKFYNKDLEPKDNERSSLLDQQNENTQAKQSHQQQGSAQIEGKVREETVLIQQQNSEVSLLTQNTNKSNSVSNKQGHLPKFQHFKVYKVCVYQSGNDQQIKDRKNGKDQQQKRQLKSVQRLAEFYILIENKTYKMKLVKKLQRSFNPILFTNSFATKSNHKKTISHSFLNLHNIRNGSGKYYLDTIYCQDQLIVQQKLIQVESNNDLRELQLFCMSQYY